MHCHVIEHVADVEGADDGAVEASLNGLYGGQDNAGIILSSSIDCAHVYGETIEYSVFVGLFCVAVVHIIDFLLFFFLLQVFVCFC